MINNFITNGTNVVCRGLLGWELHLIVKLWNLATNYLQGKRLPNKKRNKKKMKTHNNKTCLLFAYYLITITILQ
jgi:hypothetical protein